MANPCVETTDTIELGTEGSPATLFANVRNPAQTASGTQGDDTIHTVTDNDTPHTQTGTFVVDNSAGSVRMRGIVVVALNPIRAGGADGIISLLWNARLLIDSVLVDERDTVSVPMQEGEIATLSPGCLVGQIDIAPGDTATIVWTKTITNDGLTAQQWAFRMGGDKCVVQESF